MGYMMDFSLVYDGLECDERPLIQDLQDRYGFPVRYVSPDGYYRWLETEPAGKREQMDDSVG